MMTTARPTIYQPRRTVSTTVLNRLRPYLIPLGVFFVALLPRIAHLDSFITADEDDQIMFASLFLKSAIEGDLRNALVLGYPGVPTLILGAMGVALRYAAHYSGFLPLAWVDADLMTTLEMTTLEFGRFAQPLDFILWVRMPMAITAALAILAIYLLAHRILGEPLAMFGAIILAFDPFILAHSRVIHVDAPVSYFMFLAFLGFVLYLMQGRWWALIVAGLFAGLAALSKTGPAAFLGPILGVGGLIFAIAYPLSAGQTRWLYWRRLLVALFGCGAIGLTAFTALWPTMWTQPWQVIGHLVGNLQSVNSMAHPTTGHFWGGGVTDQSYLYYLVVFPYHLTPLTTVGMIAGIGMIIAGAIQFGQNRVRENPVVNWLSKHFPLAISLLAYIVLFITPVSFVTRRGDRYILPVYFASGLLAALGLWWISLIVAKLIARRVRRVAITPGRVMGAVLFVQVLGILFYHPHYLAYYNPLLGGGETAPKRLNIGWGEGLEQAAAYLNQRVGDQPKQVAAWYSNQFAPYYNGPTTDLSNHGAALYSDYTVFYLNQVQRGFPSVETLEYFRHREPLHVVEIGGIDYAWIFEGPVVSRNAPEHVDFPVGVILGGGANLLGVNVSQTTFPADVYTTLTEQTGIPRFDQPPAGLPITLHWQTINKISGEHNVYIRLVDDAGHSWGQVDRLILAGLWRPDRWRPGFTLRDEYRLPIDPATPPGTYQLEIGLYDFVTGETYGVAKNIGQITLTPPERIFAKKDLQLTEQEPTVINNELTLLNHSYVDQQLLPGSELRGKIMWQAEQVISEPYQIEFWLKNPVNGEKYSIEICPILKQHPVTDWRQGEIFNAAYRLRVPAYAPAESYPLQATVISAETGQPLGEDMMLGTITVEAVERNFDLPEQVTPTSAVLNDEIELVGYQLVDSAVAPAEPFGLKLYWRGVQPAEANYTVFVHVVGPDQTLRGQWDSLPVQGTAATSGWLPGEIIEDVYHIPMAKDAPAWKYDILVGMYDATTGQRLPVYSGQTSVSDNRIFVTQVQVE